MTNKTKVWVCIGTEESGEIVWMAAFRTIEEAREFKAHAKDQISKMTIWSPSVYWQIFACDFFTCDEAKWDLADSINEWRM